MPPTTTHRHRHTHTILLIMNSKSSFPYWEMREGDRGEGGEVGEGKSVHQGLRLKGLVLCVSECERETEVDTETERRR